MQDMRKIGAYISALRKQKDMTQVELADMLNISHQAVSKWERGESMPDVGLLPRLAEIFNKIVDDILNAGEPPKNKAQDGNRDTAVAELLQNEPGKVAEMINSGDANIETVIDMAPALRPSVVDGIAQELNGIGIEHLASLAPFLGKDTLDKLVDHVIDKTLDMNHLVEIAPFLRKDTLDRLVEQCLVGNLDGKILLELVPFVSRSTLNKLFDQVIEGTLDKKLLGEIAPFLSKETLDRLVEQYLVGNLDGKTLLELVPFVSRSTLNKLFDRVIEGTLDEKLLGEIAPFIDRKKHDNLIDSILSNKLSRRFLSDIAPFISRKHSEAC